MATPALLIPATFIKINSYLHNGNIRLVCGIRLGAEAIGEVYKVVNGVRTLIATTNALGKDDSISCVVMPDGTLVVDVSEADTGGGGITSAGRVYTFPGLLPPTIVGAAGNDATLRAALKAAVTGIQAYLTNLLKVLG